MKRDFFIFLAIAVFLTAAVSCKKDPEVPPVPPLHPAEPELIAVQGGTFTMGWLEERDDPEGYVWEKPAHQVTVSSFKIAKYPVTQKQWVALMGSNSSHFQGDENLPVEMVSWLDAQEFIAKLNEATGKKYRLATEAEWEYAARGGNKSGNFKYSGSNNIDEVAWYWENSDNKTHPVGTKKANELGIYDMSGNVWEWCNDWYAEYTVESQTNPQGPAEGSDRVFRGGSWGSVPLICRVAYRGGNTPEFRDDGFGFRLVLP
jgi:formylglycine-generating enzyme required for sulfatase activity